VQIVYRLRQTKLYTLWIKNSSSQSKITETQHSLLQYQTYDKNKQS